MHSTIALSGGDTARQCYERLATDVSASQNSREITGYAQITVTAAPGHALVELDYGGLVHLLDDDAPRRRVFVTPRVGVQGTGRWEKRLLRYCVDSPSLSRPIPRRGR